jgi:regulator of protease activity HflC (stomatin/prohibitin superfamily)
MHVSNHQTITIPHFKTPSPKRTVWVVAVVAALLIAFNLLRAAFVSVDANEIGIKVVRGHVQGTLGPGWHLISPIGGKVSKFSTRLQQTSMLRTPGEGDRPGDDSIEVASSEGARMNVDVTINYRLDKAAAVKLFQTIKSELDLRERIVRPGVRSVMRDVFAAYKAKDAITSARGEIQGVVSGRLNEKFAKQGIIVDTIDIREIYLPDTIQEQVNESIAAEAANQKVAIQRKQKETEAETARLVAEKAAEQARIEAKGKADAAIIAATGEADANRRIAESLTPGLIQLRQIEAVYKNGNQIYFLPQGASPNVFLTPSNNVGTPSTPTTPTTFQQSAAAAVTTTIAP